MGSLSTRHGLVSDHLGLRVYWLGSGCVHWQMRAAGHLFSIVSPRDLEGAPMIVYPTELMSILPLRRQPGGLE